jgi:cobalt/nickel transport system permease protein
VPAGLQRLSNFWTAPFPAYAPAFVKSRSFGYLLSAMFGVGLLLIVSLAARSWAAKSRGKESSA